MFSAAVTRYVPPQKVREEQEGGEDSWKPLDPDHRKNGTIQEKFLNEMVSQSPWACGTGPVAYGLRRKNSFRVEDVAFEAVAPREVRKNHAFVYKGMVISSSDTGAIATLVVSENFSHPNPEKKAGGLVYLDKPAEFYPKDQNISIYDPRLISLSESWPLIGPTERRGAKEKENSAAVFNVPLTEQDIKHLESVRSELYVGAASSPREAMKCMNVTDYPDSIENRLYLDRSALLSRRTREFEESLTHKSPYVQPIEDSVTQGRNTARNCHYGITENHMLRSSPESVMVGMSIDRDLKTEYTGRSVFYGTCFSTDSEDKAVQTCLEMMAQESPHFF